MSLNLTYGKSKSFANVRPSHRKDEYHKERRRLRQLGNGEGSIKMNVLNVPELIQNPPAAIDNRMKSARDIRFQGVRWQEHNSCSDQ
jgi:hypothetical protein